MNDEPRYTPDELWNMYHEFMQDKDMGNGHNGRGGIVWEFFS
jgi:hypothetical protein